MLFTALSLLALPLLSADLSADELQQEISPAVVVDYEIEAVRFEDPAPTTPFGPAVRNFRSELLLLRKIAADPDVAGVRLHLEGNLDYARTLDMLRELRAIQAAGIGWPHLNNNFILLEHA